MEQIEDCMLEIVEYAELLMEQAVAMQLDSDVGVAQWFLQSLG